MYDLQQRLYTDLIVVPNEWIREHDCLVAGIAFDKHGMHVARIFPDGEPQHELITWHEIDPSMLFPVGDSFLRYVNAVFIDDSKTRLTGEQQRLKQEIISAIFALAIPCNLRVSRGEGAKDSAASKRKSRQGRHRSLE